MGEAKMIHQKAQIDPGAICSDSATIAKNVIIKAGTVIGENVIIGDATAIGKDAVIKAGSVIGENVVIEDNVYIDHGCIIRDNVHIKAGSFIGAKSILGEYLYDFYSNRVNKTHLLTIGANALIRTENVIYGDTNIGDNFQTGHKVTIRENTDIGDNVRIGTLSDISHHVIIGNYVSIHSSCFICEESIICDYVWIFPNVTFTNDPYPPSDVMYGVKVHSFSIIAAKSLLMPGINVFEGAMVGGGAVVTKDVPKETVVVGNPARAICGVETLKNKFTGELMYPWQARFKRGMPWENSDYDTWFNSIDFENTGLAKKEEGDLNV
jgi:acetyltransferase-like isoleucine patch superfamily enzyme